MEFLQQLNDSLELIIRQTQYNANSLVIIIGILIAIHILNILSGMRLVYLGIIPRNILGLPGIICAPFIHANFNHLFFNAIPLVVLANFLLLYGTEYFIHITILLILLSGILIWFFAKPGIHIGASAVISGYWGVLVSNIYQQGTITAIILGIISLYYFAGIFFGIFPGKRGTSWEGHLFGLLSGIICSFLL